MIYFALLQLVILVIFITVGIKKQGTAFWMDLNKIFIVLWLTTLCLYNFQLTTLYNPTLQINILVMSIVVVFYIGSRFNNITETDIKLMHDNLGESRTYKRYFIASNIIFAVGATVFIANALYFGLAILEKNKIDKQTLTHYSGYFVHMLALCAQIKYVMYRRFKKREDLLVLFLSVFVLFLTLNRGPITFIIMTVYIYEAATFIKNKDTMSKNRIRGTYSAIALAGIGFFQLFAYVGNLRMNYALTHIYRTTIQQFYGMHKYVPTSFLWFYIYLTSPLENAAYSIVKQSVQYTYFNNLLYPFIKLGANILGQGDNYKAWIMSRSGYTPYLWNKVGLNASSFIIEGFQDLDIIGVLVYIIIYFILIRWATGLLKRKVKFSSIGIIIIYSNILNILLWSVFVNSLKIPILILNIIAVLVIELDSKYGYSNKILANKYVASNIMKLKKVRVWKKRSS